MGFKNYKQDIQDILFWFVGGSQCPPSTSLPPLLSPGAPQGAKFLSGFTRFLKKNLWDLENIINGPSYC
jgi:hypothetical protein